METKAYANLREMKAEIGVSKETFEVLRGTLVARMDIHQARTEGNQRETTVKMEAC
jgi:hypothetical protein